MAAQKIINVTEQKRLNDAREVGIPWKKWGPFLSERQWGTVRRTTTRTGWEGLAMKSNACCALASPVDRAGPHPEGAPVHKRGPGSGSASSVADAVVLEHICPNSSKTPHESSDDTGQ